MSRTKPTGQPDDAVKRRDFILRGALAALGIPIGAAALEGCAGEAAIVGAVLDDGGISLAAQVRKSRATLDDVQDAMGTNLSPNLSKIRDWLNKFNRAVDKTQDKARRSKPTPIEANVESNMVEFLAALKAQGTPLDYSGGSRSFSSTILLQAVQTTETILVGRSNAARRELWILVLGLAILNPASTNNQVLVAAELARQADQDDVSGRAYDRFFPAVAPTADQPAGQFPLLFEAALLIFAAMLPNLDRSPAMLLGPFYLVILIVAAILLVGLQTE